MGLIVNKRRYGRIEFRWMSSPALRIIFLFIYFFVLFFSEGGARVRGMYNVRVWSVPKRAKCFGFDMSSPISSITSLSAVLCKSSCFPALLPPGIPTIPLHVYRSSFVDARKINKTSNGSNFNCGNILCCSSLVQVSATRRMTATQACLRFVDGSDL